MNKFIAYCGLDCEKCDARIAAINNDDILREKTAKLWSEMNGVTITKEMINCTGCRVEGVKTPYCESLCPIRKCAESKGFNTCGNCTEFKSCHKLAEITDNNQEALLNLKKMNGIILYKSKYGSAKRYAQWLSEETGFACIETQKADINEIEKYDVIILGGGIYASGIAGITFLKKNISRLKDKKIAVFCCGASPYEKEAFEQIKAHNFKDELSEIPCFYCRGAWDMEAMSFKDRTLCKMLRKAVSKKDPSEYEIWEKALMAAGDEKCDWTDKKYILPVIQSIGIQK